jgi:hypothetical protein
MPDHTRAEETRDPGKTVSTPEGDNEYAPDQPLEPSAVESDVDGLQRWPSNSRMEYDKNPDSRDPAHDSDDPNAARPKGVQRVIDEISTGKILPG